MTQSEREVLFKEIDDIALKACRLMTDDERESYFAYQEERKRSNASLKTKYDVPVRTYYKGKNAGEVKKVFEVNGAEFEKLWNKLYKYAVKSAMGSHQASHYNNPDVQNDICDIRYQTFYVLRYFGPTPSSRTKTYTFSEFFVLIVNNILTTSARRRGVYREVSDFWPWFNENKHDDLYFDSYTNHVLTAEGYVSFIDYMFCTYVRRYHAKAADDILKSLAEYNAYLEIVRTEKRKKKNHTFVKPFYFNAGNCESTMVNFKADSIYDALDNDSDEPVYYADILEDHESVPPDTDIRIRELLDSCMNAFDIRILDDELMKKPIKRLIKGESLTQIAKSLNIKVEELRESLRGILPSLQ